MIKRICWLLMSCLLVGCNDNNNDVPEPVIDPVIEGEGNDGPKPGEIWYFPGITFTFNVEDANGQDLLNPATPGSYAGMNIMAIHRDTIYNKDKPVYIPGVIRGDDIYKKSISMAGLSTSESASINKKYILHFGAFDPNNKYENEEIVFIWPDNSQDTLRFSNELTWKNYEPEFICSYSFNGKEFNREDGSLSLQKKPMGTMGQGEEWDLLPLKFYLVLRNEDGRDLLNPDTMNDVASNRVTATLQGKEYVMDDPALSADSTAIGLRKHKQEFGNYHYLTFGEFDGREVFDNENLVLDWGNGKQDIITFTSKMVIEDGKPTFVRQYALNGEVLKTNTSFPIIYITKPFDF